MPKIILRDTKVGSYTDYRDAELDSKSGYLTIFTYEKTSDDSESESSLIMIRPDEVVKLAELIKNSVKGAKL